MNTYIIYGVEHVYDAFDDYEHPNSLPPVKMDTESVEDAITKAEKYLNKIIYEERKKGGFLSTGSFVGEVVQVVDENGYVIYQNSGGLVRIWGGHTEDYRKGATVPFLTCFISYPTKDDNFAKQLYDDFRKMKIRCWFAPIDMSSKHIEKALHQAIQNMDKFLIVMSQHSIESKWVKYEVDTALEKEREWNERLIYPILIDNSLYDNDAKWISELSRRGYHSDFSKWQTPNEYEKAVNALIDGAFKHLSTEYKLKA